MTRDETVKIIRIMCDCYPNYKPSNLSETVDVWNMMLEEYSYSQISMALKLTCILIQADSHRASDS